MIKRINKIHDVLDEEGKISGHEAEVTYIDDSGIFDPKTRVESLTGEEAAALRGQAEAPMSAALKELSDTNAALQTDLAAEKEARVADVSDKQAEIETLKRQLAEAEAAKPSEAETAAIADTAALFEEAKPE